MKRKMIRAAVGTGVALSFALVGCGGRVSQVNVGVEQAPGDIAGNQGTGGERQAATPMVTGPGGTQVGQESAAIPECPMTRRSDFRFFNGVGTASSDGSLLAVVGYYYSPLQVFDVADDTAVSGFEIPSSHTYQKATLSPDNSLVAVSGLRDDGSSAAVAVYRVSDGALLANLPVSGGTLNSGNVVAPDFSHDGRSLATAGGGKATVEIWSVPDFHRVRAISLADKYGPRVSSVHFSPDDTRLVTARMGTLAVLNVADLSLVWAQPLSSRVDSGDAIFSPNGTLVVSGGNYEHDDSGAIAKYEATRIWDAATGALIQELSSLPVTGSASLSMYDEDHLLIGDDPRGARIWARGATGLLAPSCFLTSERPPPSGASPGGDGPARVTASVGGKLMYVMGTGSWIYEQAP